MTQLERIETAMRLLGHIGTLSVGVVGGRLDNGQLLAIVDLREVLWAELMAVVGEASDAVKTEVRA